MAEAATERVALRDMEIGWPVEELWVSGDLLTLTDTLDSGSVVVVLDVPPDEAPWLAVNAEGESAGALLRLGKRPLLWCYRPMGWPAWNHEHRRVARYWSVADGLDPTVIDALRDRRLDHLEVVAPTQDELAGQLRTELVVSRAHLRDVLDRYWDHDWRRGGRRGAPPEDHLWRAAEAVSGMLDALDELRTAMA
jgi:hypothetical protein